MYQLIFYVPESHLESVKQSLFSAGAGKIGNYDCCCWQVKGFGQFRPLDGSNPFSGKANKIHQESEWRVEMVCDDNMIEIAIDSLKKTHPYEEPAYQYWKVNA